MSDPTPEQVQKIRTPEQVQKIRTPEQVQEMMRLYALDQQGNVLANQVAQANALRLNAPETKINNPIGAGIGAFGDAIDKVSNAYDARKARQGQQANIGQQGDALTKIAALLAGQGGGADGPWGAAGPNMDTYAWGY